MFVSVLGLLLLTRFAQAEPPKRYFAPPYDCETRFERKGLVTVDSWIAHGTTTKGQNDQAKTTNILNIYGPMKVQQLGRNVVNSGLSTHHKSVLNALANHTPTTNDENYATLEFSGKCSYTGGGLKFGANLTDQFFVGCEIPFYKLNLHEITFKDLTAEEDKDAEWNQVFALFDEILTAADVDRFDYKAQGLGDITIHAGWTRSTEDLDQLDFLDATLKLGALLATANGKSQKHAFSMEPGYGKHYGVLLSFDMAFGFSDCASFGLHFNELFFIKRTKCMRIQTDSCQNGHIKLTKTNITDSHGNIYDVGGHFKLEQGRAGFIAAYTYCHKARDVLAPLGNSPHSGAAMNSDLMLREWSKHTFHLTGELDFADDENKRIHPKCSISYNHILRARRAFLNHTVAGTLGFSVTFDF